MIFNFVNQECRANVKLTKTKYSNVELRKGDKLHVGKLYVFHVTDFKFTNHFHLICKRLNDDAIDILFHPVLCLYLCTIFFCFYDFYFLLSIAQL